MATDPTDLIPLAMGDGASTFRHNDLVVLPYFGSQPITATTKTLDEEFSGFRAYHVYTLILCQQQQQIPADFPFNVDNMDGLALVNDKFGSDDILNTNMYVEYFYHAQDDITLTDLKELSNKSGHKLVKEAIDEYQTSLVQGLSDMIERIPNVDIKRLDNLELGGSLALLMGQKRFKFNIHGNNRFQHRVSMMFDGPDYEEFVNTWKTAPVFKNRH